MDNKELLSSLIVGSVMDRRQRILEQDGTDPLMRNDKTKKDIEVDEVNKDEKDSQLYVKITYCYIVIKDMGFKMVFQRVYV